MAVLAVQAAPHHPLGHRLAVQPSSKLSAVRSTAPRALMVFERPPLACWAGSRRSARQWAAGSHPPLWLSRMEPFPPATRLPAMQQILPLRLALQPAMPAAGTIVYSAVACVSRTCVGSGALMTCVPLTESGHSVAGQMLLCIARSIRRMLNRVVQVLGSKLLSRHAGTAQCICGTSEPCCAWRQPQLEAKWPKRRAGSALGDSSPNDRCTACKVACMPGSVLLAMAACSGWLCAVQLAQAAVDKRNYPTVLKHCTAAINLRASGKTHNAMMYHNRAWVHQAMRQYALAAADSSRSIALDDSQWNKFHIRHRAWRLMGLNSLALPR